MKTACLIAIAMVTTPESGLGKSKQCVEPKVTVYLDNEANVPSPLLAWARAIASEMFASIGVHVDWRPGQPTKLQSAEHVIAVRLANDAPSSQKATTVAYASLGKEQQLTVLYQRLSWALAKPGLAPALLAHVLVHEITHIVEGTARHSGAGVMKANWDSSDYYFMQTKTLAFAQEDKELMHRGLAQRDSGLFRRLEAEALPGASELPTP